jgi:hypothetical protein
MVIKYCQLNPNNLIREENTKVLSFWCHGKKGDAATTHSPMSHHRFCFYFNVNFMSRFRASVIVGVSCSVSTDNQFFIKHFHINLINHITEAPIYFDGLYFLVKREVCKKLLQLAGPFHSLFYRLNSIRIISI